MERQDAPPSQNKSHDWPNEIVRHILIGEGGKTSSPNTFRRTIHKEVRLITIDQFEKFRGSVRNKGERQGSLVRFLQVWVLWWEGRRLASRTQSVSGPRLTTMSYLWVQRVLAGGLKLECHCAKSIRTRDRGKSLAEDSHDATLLEDMNQVWNFIVPSGFPSPSHCSWSTVLSRRRQ